MPLFPTDKITASEHSLLFLTPRPVPLEGLLIDAFWFPRHLFSVAHLYRISFSFLSSSFFLLFFFSSFLVPRGSRSGADDDDDWREQRPLVDTRQRTKIFYFFQLTIFSRITMRQPLPPRRELLPARLPITTIAHFRSLRVFDRLRCTMAYSRQQADDFTFRFAAMLISPRVSFDIFIITGYR